MSNYRLYTNPNPNAGAGGAPPYRIPTYSAGGNRSNDPTSNVPRQTSGYTTRFRATATSPTNSSMKAPSSSKSTAPSSPKQYQSSPSKTRHSLSSKPLRLIANIVAALIILLIIGACLMVPPWRTMFQSSSNPSFRILVDKPSTRYSLFVSATPIDPNIPDELNEETEVRTNRPITKILAAQGGGGGNAAPQPPLSTPVNEVVLENIKEVTVIDPTPVSNTEIIDGVNPLLTHSVFKTTAGGYPLLKDAKDKKYSHFHCMGGRGRENTYADRSCRFQNLCYKPSIDQWQYFVDPVEADFPVLLDHGMFHSRFPEYFLNLRSMGIKEDARNWAPTMIFENEIPETAYVGRKNPDVADITILYHPHYPSNIGHVIGDDFYPLFNLMTSFGMLTDDAQLIIQRDCSKIFAGMVKKTQACHMFLEMLSPGISKRSILAATQPDLANALGTSSTSDLICFENVLAGSGPWGFQQSLGKAPTWRDYHYFYLANLDLNGNHTPKKHRITVSVKDGKRSIFNNNEMVAHLRQAFPDYEVDAIQLKDLGGWKNELAYLLDTTVLITPCGGVSMSAMFLPHGASLIVVDYWDLKKNNTGGMEEKLWTNLGYIRPFHYQFTENEVVLDVPGRKRNNFQDMRDWGRVNVNLPRMETLVRAAIAHVDNFMIFGQD